MSFWLRTNTVEENLQTQFLGVREAAAYAFASGCDFIAAVLSPYVEFADYAITHRWQRRWLNATNQR